MRKTYVRPSIREIGDLRHMTKGDVSGGWDDSFTLSLGRLGDITIPLPGHDPNRACGTAANRLGVGSLPTPAKTQPRRVPWDVLGCRDIAPELL